MTNYELGGRIIWGCFFTTIFVIVVVAFALVMIYVPGAWQWSPI